MAITWTIDGVEQIQWDLWNNKPINPDPKSTEEIDGINYFNDIALDPQRATDVAVTTFVPFEGDGATYDFCLNTNFLGKSVSDPAITWTNYIAANGAKINQLKFQNPGWDNDKQVFLYIRRTEAGKTEYAAYKVFVDTEKPVFGDGRFEEEGGIDKELPRDEGGLISWGDKEWWNDAKLTLTFDDTDAGALVSSGIAAIKYYTTSDPLDPESWVPAPEEKWVKVNPKTDVTYDKEKKLYVLTALFPDSIDQDADDVADACYFKVALVDASGNEISLGNSKVFEAKKYNPLPKDTDQSVVAAPVKQDATAPVIPVDDPENPVKPVTGVHVANNEEDGQRINGKGPKEEGFKVVTDLNNLLAPGQFTIAGKAQTQEQDGGSALSVVVTYTVKYQELVGKDGKYSWSDVKTVNKEATTDYDGSEAKKNWTSKPINIQAGAIGYYDVVAKVRDAAGNESEYDHYYVYFDNTRPASPDVALSDASAKYDEDTRSSYIKAFGSDSSVTVAPGTYGDHDKDLYQIDLKKEEDGETIYYKFAARKGALDFDALYAARAHVTNQWGTTPGVINLANFENFWADSIVDGKVKQDAYSVIFFTQNVYDVESSAEVNQVSVVRFVVDSAKPTDLIFDLSEDGTLADGIHWFSDVGAEVTLTLKAYDLYGVAGKTLADMDHVSGVDVFTVDGKEYEAVLDSTNEADVFYKYVIENVRKGDPGVVTYDFTATDGAGNVSDAYSKAHDPFKVGIDNAAPVINNVYVTWGDGQNDKRLIQGDTIVFSKADLDYFAEKGIEKFWLTVYAVDLCNEETGERGVGLITDNNTKTYWSTDGGDSKHHFIAGGKETLHNATNIGTDYDFQIKYTDLFDHGMKAVAEYHVKFDDGMNFTVAGNYSVNDEPDDDAPFGPQLAPVLVDDFDDLNDDPATEKVIPYASKFDLTFTIVSTGGIEYWTVTKTGVEEPVMSYPAAGVAVSPITLDTAGVPADIEKWQLEDGINEYTITIKDKAGNPVERQTITLKYDSKVTGTVEVIDDHEAVITKNDDGKYYVSTNDYKLKYAVVDTEENPEISGADLVYFDRVGAGNYENLGFDAQHTTRTVQIADKLHNTETNHDAMVTDKAGNRGNVGAIVVVDKQAPTMTVEAVIATTTRKDETVTPLVARRDLVTNDVTTDTNIPAGAIAIDPEKPVTVYTVNWTTNFTPKVLQINVVDPYLLPEQSHMETVTVNGEVFKTANCSIKFATADYVGESDYQFTEGSNSWTIVATDKAGNETAVQLVINYDITAPVVSAVKLDGYDVTDMGGTTYAKVLENKVTVSNANKFVLTVDATDNVEEPLKVYYSFAKGSDVANAVDFTNAAKWSVWKEVDDGTIKSSETGFYHFAVVDAAGNVTQSNYYFVDQAQLPAQAVVSYKDEKGVVITDVDSKGWLNYAVKVLADFESCEDYDQWNFVAYKFDEDAYRAAYAAAVEAGEKPNAAALLAAVHTTKEEMIEGKFNENFVVTMQETKKDKSWTWESAEYVEAPTEYWMFSITTDDNATVGEYKYQYVKVDASAPEITLDLHGYVEGTWTNQTVTIDMDVTSQSKIVSQTPLVLPDVVSEEGVWSREFTATNEAGTTSKKYVDVKIDKTGPVIARNDDYADGTWSKVPVTISATATDNLSGILSGELIVPEVTFEQAVTAEGETMVEWTVTDVAGNVSNMSVKVMVDTVAPEMTLDAGGYEFNTWTNQTVTVTVTATDATSGIKSQTESPVVFENEGIYHQLFFAEDNAGNVTSEVKDVKIDKTAPVIVSVTHAPDKEIVTSVIVTATFSDIGGSGLKYGEYSVNGEDWTQLEVEESKASFIVTSDTIYLRATDNAGNVSGVTEYEIDNLALDYAEVSGEGSATVDDLELVVSGEYKMNVEDLGDITGKLTVKNNGKAAFTATIEGGKVTKTSNKDGSMKFMLDNSKRDVEVVMDVNEKKSGASTEWDIQILTGDKRFIEGYNGDDTALTAQELDTLTDGCQGSEIIEDWVGYGDTIDYYTFDLEGSATLKFDFEAEDTAKMTVYQYNGLDKKGNIKLKSLGNVAISAKEIGTTKSTKDLLVTSGTYFIAIESTNKKLGAGEYEVTVAESSQFYPADEDLNLNNQTWKTASVMDEDDSTRWVGFGDAADFYKFSVSDDGKIKFELDDEGKTAAAVQNKELKITCLTANGKSVALDKLNGNTIESKKSMAAGEYILGVTCANTKKYNTYYDITIA